MASKNDITGDKIQTKGVLSKEGEANWDKIFGKNKNGTRLSATDPRESAVCDEEVNAKRLTDAFPGL